MWKFKATARMINRLIGVLLLILFTWLGLSAALNGCTFNVSQVLECIVFLVVFFVTTTLFSALQRRAEISILVVFELVSIFECILGILQILGLMRSNHGVFILTGTFGNPGPFGGFVAVVTAMAAVDFWRNREKLLTGGWKVSRNLPIMLSLTTLVLGALVLPASMSRAAWLSVVVALLVFVFAELGFSVWIGRHKMLTMIGTVVAVALLVGMFALKQDSAVGRLHIWHMELHVIADHQLFGVGPGNEFGAYGQAQEKYFRTKPRSMVEVQAAGCPEYAFNEYLKFGMQGGVLCLLFVAALVVVSIAALQKSGSVLTYGMIAFSVFAFFSYPLSCFLMLLLSAVFFAAAGSAPAHKIFAGEFTFVKHVFPVVFVVLLFGGAAFVVLFFTSACYEMRREALSKWESSQHLGSMEMYVDQAEVLASLHNSLHDEMSYLYDYGYALHRTGRYNESNAILSEGAAISCDPVFHVIMGKNHEAMGNYEKAEEEYLHAHYMVPCRLYPLVLLMEMKLSQGRRADAVLLCEEILSMPVNGRNLTMADLRRRVSESPAAQRIRTIEFLK